MSKSKHSYSVLESRDYSYHTRPPHNLEKKKVKLMTTAQGQRSGDDLASSERRRPAPLHHENHQASDEIDHQKQATVPTAIAATIASFMTASNRMIPLNVHVYISKAMEEMLRRDAIPVLPAEVFSRVADFISDRKTFNRLSLASKEINWICNTKLTKPWPARLRLQPEIQRGPVVFFGKDSQSIYQIHEDDRNILIHRLNRNSGPCQLDLAWNRSYFLDFSQDGKYSVRVNCDDRGNSTNVLTLVDLTSDEGCLFDILPPSEDIPDMQQYYIDHFEFIQTPDALSAQHALIAYGSGGHFDLVFAVVDLTTKRITKTLRDVLKRPFDSVYMDGNVVMWELPGQNDDIGLFKYKLWNYNCSHVPITVTAPIGLQLDYLSQNPKLPDIVGVTAYSRPSHSNNSATIIHFGILRFDGSDADSLHVTGATFSSRMAPSQLPVTGPLHPIKGEFFGWFPDGKHAFYISGHILQPVVTLRFDQGEMLLEQVADSDQGPVQERFTLHVQSFLRDIAKDEGLLLHAQISLDCEYLLLTASSGLVKVLPL